MTKTIKTKPFDAAKYLKTEEMMAGFLSEALGTGDPAFIAHSLGVVARARGMTDLARATGLSRESLYRALSEEGRPEFETVVKVIGALGLKLSAAPASPKALNPEDTNTTPRSRRRTAVKSAQRKAA